eukprot:4205397-Amphidinium_carterae.1
MSRNPADIEVNNHLLRERLCAHWWNTMVPGRPNLNGAEAGIDIQATCQPLLSNWACKLPLHAGSHVWRAIVGDQSRMEPK